jgi:hypothetical protein
MSRTGIDTEQLDPVARLKILERRFDALEKHLEQRWEDHEKALGAGGVSGMRDDLNLLQLHVYGDEKMGLRPLRKMVEDLDKLSQRVKWAGGALVTSNVGAIAAWVNTLFN